MAKPRSTRSRGRTRNTDPQRRSATPPAPTENHVHVGAAQAAQATQASQPAQTTQPNTNKERGIRMALTTEQIAQLLANTRTKGQYTGFLNAFLESGEQGVCANDEWVEIKDKKASTIKQGFVNAIDKKDAPEDAKYVKVLVNEEKVYLINVKAAGVEVDEPEVEEAAA